MTGAPGLALLGLSLAAAAASLAYLAGASWAVFAWRRGRASTPVRTPGTLPPVTVLKPLRGAEPGLDGNLRSFCEQDYPQFQVVFGVRDPDDPALAVARRLAAEFSERDIQVVVDGRQSGGNFKASNLANMMAAARHEYLVVADSDVRVGPDYLRSVVAPLADAGVGVVTCLYCGWPDRPLWSRLAALYINDEFLPSVLVARALGSRSPCFGATLALRRDVLEAIGGFPALAPYLADDYALGQLVRRRGLVVELSRYVVETVASESSATALIEHELRWARTIRAVAPWGYAFYWVRFGFPLSWLPVAFGHGAAWTLAFPPLALALRYLLHSTTRRALARSGPPSAGLVPVRDLLSLGLWAWGFLSRRVRWRGERFAIEPDGRMRPVTS